MHLTLDGFTTPYLLHAIRAVEDESSSGSVAMINSDILQDVALVSGGYVQRSGNRTGASVEFNVRSGSRERPQVRAAVSGTGVSLVVEGPLPGRARLLAGLGAPELSRPRDRAAGRRPGAVRVLGRAGQGRVRPEPVAARAAHRSRRPFPVEGTRGSGRRQRFVRRPQRVGDRHRPLAVDRRAERRERRRHGRRQPLQQRDDWRHRSRPRPRAAGERALRRAAPAVTGDRARGRRRSGRPRRVTLAAASGHVDHLSGHQRLRRRRDATGRLRVGALDGGALAQRASRRARGPFEPDRRLDGVALAAGGVACLAWHRGAGRDRRLPAVPDVRAGHRRVGDAGLRSRARDVSRRGRGAGDRSVGPRCRSRSTIARSRTFSVAPASSHGWSTAGSCPGREPRATRTASRARRAASR